MRKCLKVFSFSQFSVHGLFFKQTDVNLIIPIVNGAPNIHDKNRLIKFDVSDLSTNTHNFTLIEKKDYLHLNAVSGELWFHRSKWDNEPHPMWKVVSEKYKVKVMCGELEANTTITLNFTPYSSFKDFCEHQMCFYNAITFNTLEDFHENFKSRELGKFAPKFHQRICKDYKVEYKLINGELKVFFNGCAN